MIALTRLKQLEDIAAAIREIYGRDLPDPAGCVQVTAVWQRSAEELITLKILDETPRSFFDFFVLNLARARADAIVTTGAILRSEPDLTHEPPSPDPPWTALQQWRAAVLGKESPPRSAILTSGRDLDFGHPIFRSRNAAVVFTGVEAADRLMGRAPQRVEIVALENPGIRAVTDCLRQQFGSRTTLVEAGPSTSKRLYQDPPQVDELMLSLYCQDELAQEVRGGLFLSWPELRRVFSEISAAYPVQEKSGPWRFHLLTRT